MCSPKSVWKGSLELGCSYVLSHSEACDSGGFVFYAKLIWCSSSPAEEWLKLTGLVVLLIALFALLYVEADHFFRPNLYTLAQLLRMNENIAGVTLLALGNGAPDIFSALAAVLGTKTAKPGLALGALLGSGLFLTTVVAGVVTLIRPTLVLRRPLLRDLAFYVVAVAAVTAFLLNGHLRLYEAIAFLFWYVAYEAIAFLLWYLAYVGTVLAGRWLRLRWLARLPEDRDALGADEGTDEGDEQELPPDLPRSQTQVAGMVGTTEQASLCSDVRAHWALLTAALRPWEGEWAELGAWDRASALAFAPLIVLLRLCVPVVDMESHPSSGGWCKPLGVVQALVLPSVAFALTAPDVGASAHGLPILYVCGVAGALMAIGLAAGTRRSRPPAGHKLLSLVGFGVAILWIYATANEVVGLVCALGTLLDLPEDVLGFTVVAWANSVGDLASDVAVARSGKPVMALTACFAGPLFNLLIGLGLPFSIAAFSRPLAPLTFPLVRKELVGFLAAGLLCSLVLLPASKFRTNRPYAVLLILIYVVFLVIALLTLLGFLG